MRDIYLVGSKKDGDSDIKTLILSRIEYLDFEIDFGEFDGLLFTSKSGVESINRNGADWKRIPAFVIGASTGKYLENIGGKVEYVGEDSHGKSFFDEIKNRLENRKILYIRAENIVSNIDKKLRKVGVKIESIIGYRNVKIGLDRELKPKKDSIIIFGAPSHYRNFVENFAWDDSYIAVAIGETTKGVFDKNMQCFVSQKRDIESTKKLAREIRDREINL